MDCREVRRLADAYVSDQVLVETAQAIGAHLETCPTCRAEIEGLRRLRASVRSAVLGASALAMRPAFAAELTERLKAEAERRAAGGHRRTWLALAAAVLLAVAAGLGLQQWGARAWTALVLAAAGDHQNCALVFALDEPPIPLAEAAERYGGVHRLIERMRVPTVTASGAQLELLDRHSCVFDGQRFVHIVVRYKDETVSVLVADDPRPGLLSWSRAADGVLARVQTAGAFTMTSFAGGRHAAFVVSTLGGRDVQEVAQAMSAPLTRALTGI